MSEYVCEACKGVFVMPTDWNPWDEALDTFAPAELEDVAIVCDDCWNEMRDAMPDFDARYA